MWTILLLIGSNIFMTIAWYGHLKHKEVALWKVMKMFEIGEHTSELQSPC